MSWTNPDPWQCYVCGAEGLGGREAGDRHDRTAHAPRYNRNPVGSVVPDGVSSADVRAWALVNGWPSLGTRGRLPQAAIDAYMTAQS